MVTAEKKDVVGGAWWCSQTPRAGGLHRGGLHKCLGANCCPSVRSDQTMSSRCKVCVRVRFPGVLRTQGLSKQELFTCISRSVVGSAVIQQSMLLYQEFSQIANKLFICRKLKPDFVCSPKHPLRENFENKCYLVYGNS